MTFRLPNELISEIGSFLSPNDAQRARSTCRYWKGAFEDNPRPWQNIVIELKEDESISPALKGYLSLSRDRPVDLCVQRICGTHYYDLGELLCDHLHHIQRLELRFEGGHRHTRSHMAYLLQRLNKSAPILISFTLICIVGIVSGRSVTPFPAGIFAGEAPKLVDLAIDVNFMVRIATASHLPTQITSLTMQPHEDHQQTIPEISITYPNVRNLHLIGPWGYIYPGSLDDGLERTEWARLDQLTITTCIGEDGDVRDSAADKAIRLACRARLRGVPRVSLLLDHALDRAVEQILPLITVPIRVHVGRGGHARPLQCLWRRLGGNYSIDIGLFIEVSDATCALTVGDSSLDGEHADDVMRSLLIQMDWFKGLLHLSVCESAISAMQCHASVIDLPLLKSISILVSSIKERMSAELSDIYEEDETADEAGAGADFTIKAPSLTTLQLTSWRCAPPFSRTFIDVHGRWDDVGPEQPRCVSATSLATFIARNLVVSDAASLDIVLTDRNIVFAEGFQNGKDALKPNVVMYQV